MTFYINIYIKKTGDNINNYIHFMFYILLFLFLFILFSRLHSLNKNQ